MGNTTKLASRGPSLAGLLWILIAGTGWATEPNLARIAFWVPPERMEEFEASYEQQVVPLLQRRGLNPSSHQGRATPDSVFSRLLEIESLDRFLALEADPDFGVHGCDADPRPAIRNTASGRRHPPPAHDLSGQGGHWNVGPRRPRKDPPRPRPRALAHLRRQRRTRRRRDRLDGGGRRWTPLVRRLGQGRSQPLRRPPVRDLHH